METKKYLFQRHHCLPLFLSYLWGMETCFEHGKSFNSLDSSYPTYEEWKHGKMRLRGEYKEVLILPMRNGNLFPDGCIRRYASSFLSYLWGMETAHLITFSINNNFCSYPTYEEWKPSGLSVFVLTILKRSYPTYEEWNSKLIWNPLHRMLSFLSYLWGMETLSIPHHYFRFLSVLILPMRNGNNECKLT